MNAWTRWTRHLQLAVAGLILGIVGCSGSDPGSAPEDPAYAASGGIPPSAPAASTPPPAQPDVAHANPPADPSTDDQVASKSDPAESSQSSPVEASPEPPDQPPSADQLAEDQLARMRPPGQTGRPRTPFTLEGADDPADESSNVQLRELRADLAPAQLLEFLSIADRDMQVIVSGRSGITDPKEARKTLLHIVKMKLEAARRLAGHADADDQARSEGARGELQSLSHLAALGDLKAAEQLENLAEANLESDDQQLVSDSRLVLIGFAIESLQHGNEEAADKIVRYIRQLASSEAKPDVAAMLVMGQARESLELYGHQDQARQVRDWIIELFAHSSEPQIAEMAAVLAGNVRFDAIDRLLDQVVNGEQVDVDRWRQSVKTLMEESADLQTVQYLAGAALEFESLGHKQLVETTYDALSKRFDDPSAATTREVNLAIAAYQARQDVIGGVFSPDLPAVGGVALSMTDFRGKVVLMPFWAMSFPHSLQLVQKLKAVRDAHPDKVAIVGINLDPEGAPVEDFLKGNDLGFPSFRAASSPSAEVANEVAARFGMVSMPFTAIVDTDGRVAAINFTGRDLEVIVENLIKQ